MDIGESFKEHHTAISLIAGPLIVWLVWRIPKLHWTLRLILLVGVLLLAIGVWGMILNSYLVPVLLVWYSTHKGFALKPIRYATLSIAIILFVAAVAFILYVFYRHPDEIIKNLRNPLLVVYFFPGLLAMIFSSMVKEKIDDRARTAEETANEDRDS
jgi:lysylphosphatidylglycerol synthetase-like protein (DUF2156 family)